MNIRQQKRAIACSATLLALLGVGLLAAALFTPVEAPDPGNPTSPAASAPPARIAPAPVTHLDGPAIAELLQLCQTDLRRPLESAGPLAVEESVAGGAASAMTVRLVGTVIEPGRSMALLQKPDGSIEVCAEGESVDDPAGKVTVLRVLPQKVTVRFAGGSHEMVVAEAPAGGA